MGDGDGDTLGEGCGDPDGEGCGVWAEKFMRIASKKAIPRISAFAFAENDVMNSDSSHVCVRLINTSFCIRVFFVCFV